LWVSGCPWHTSRSNPQPEQLFVDRDVRVERDLDDVIDPVRRVIADAFNDLVAAEACGINDVMGARPLCDRHITF
jgi:hypothetical protein